MIKYWSHIGLLAAIIAICCLSQCAMVRGDLYDQSKAYLASLDDTITYLKNGIAQKAAVEVSPDLFKELVGQNEELQKQLKDAKIKAKNVHTITTVVTNTEIDTISITLRDTIPCDDFAPIPFRADSQYYSIAGDVTKRAIRLSKVSFPDSLYVITADRKHLFRKNEFIVSIGHSNPNVKTVGLTNLTVTEERKWWQNMWIERVVVLAVGAYAAKTFLK